MSVVFGWVGIQVSNVDKGLDAPAHPSATTLWTPRHLLHEYYVPDDQLWSENSFHHMVSNYTPHLRGRDGSVSRSFVGSVVNLLVWTDGDFLQVLHVKKSQFGILANLKSSFWIVFRQQIANLLVINFQHGKRHLESLWNNGGAWGVGKEPMVIWW